MLIAEHSMCQPGRPGPIAVSQLGSPGLGPFHSAKSRTSSLAYSSASTRSPVRICSGSSRASRPYDGQDEIRKKIEPSSVRYAWPPAEQRLDELDHPLDVLGRAGQDVGRRHAQGGGVGQERGQVPVGQLADADAGRGRAPDDLVVDVGDVHDPADRVAAPAQVADQEVGEQERAEVADVRRAVDRRTARVDADDLADRVRTAASRR